MTKKHDPFEALRYLSFRKYILAKFFIAFSLQMQIVLISWQVYEITNDPFSLGLLGLIEAIPSIGVALIAGHIADNFNRKLIIIINVILLTICSFYLYIISLGNFFDISQGISLYSIYFVVFLSGLARGFLNPSYFAMLAQLVPKSAYPNSSTWNSSIWHFSCVGGPAIGGLIYGYLGLSFAYLMDFILIASSILIILLISHQKVTKKSEKETITQSIQKGIKFVFKNQIILGAISLDLFAVLFGGAVALLPIFAKDILKTGPEGLGILRASPSAGALLMAGILVYKPVVKNTGQILFTAVTGFGLTMFFFALSTNYYLSIVLLALSGAFDNVSVVIRSTIIQLFTPDDMRGRVSSVNNIFIGSSNEIGAFESGLTAKIFGTIPSVILGSCLTLVSVATIMFLTPKLKNLSFENLHKKT